VPHVSHVDTEAVRDAFRRGWLGGAELRKEDEQKVKELVPLLGEVARMASRISAEPLTVVDLCAGKGALSVLSSLLVLRARKHAVHVIERDGKYAQRCLDAARTLGVQNEISFHTSDVTKREAWPSERTDLVLALHACGGASDDVIDTAIAADARAILLVPCCYGAGPRHEGAGLEVHAQSLADAWVARLPLPAHALVSKRMAQSFIDAERTLRLEAAGYETEVVEAFAATLSPHNLLWRARRVKEPVRMQRAATTLASLASLASLTSPTDVTRDSDPTTR
jgi:hypothetical protein